MFGPVKRWFESSTAATPVTASEQNAGKDAYRAGLACFTAGDYAAAETQLRSALAVRHDLAEAHFYLGLVLRKRGELEEAADSLLLATVFRPDFAEAWHYAGVVALNRGELDDAQRCIKKALLLNPVYAEAHHNLGAVCEQREQLVEAATHYKKSVGLKPDYALAYCNLAKVTLRGEFDGEAALRYIRRALDLEPSMAAVHNNLAMILQFQGRCEEALESAERALALDPAAVNTLLIRAHARLMLGQFAPGWRDYEARKQLLPTFKVRRFPYPEWEGAAPAGHTMLVCCEQGLGDEIMFASCLPDLLRLDAQCVVECSLKLGALFRRSFPQAQIVVADQSDPDMSYLQALPHFDWRIAAGSLPIHFRNDWGDFPAHDGYLAADQCRIEYWRRKLDGLGRGLKIGIAWRGGRQNTNQARRSLTLAELAPLLGQAGAHFVSLQHTECRGEIEQMRASSGATLHHWQEAIDDYDETAALVSALDLVISVQTAVIHLGGALGRPHLGARAVNAGMALHGAG